MEGIIHVILKYIINNIPNIGMANLPMDQLIQHSSQGLFSISATSLDSIGVVSAVH